MPLERLVRLLADYEGVRVGRGVVLRVARRERRAEGVRPGLLGELEVDGHLTACVGRAGRRLRPEHEVDLLADDGLTVLVDEAGGQSDRLGRSRREHARVRERRVALRHVDGAGVDVAGAVLVTGREARDVVARGRVRMRDAGTAGGARAPVTEAPRVL